MEEQNNFEQQPSGGQPSSYEYTMPSGGQPASKGTNTLAVVSLILGIASLLVACACCVADSPVVALVVSILGVVAGIAAIVTCVLSKKEGKSGMATAGLVCGIIGIIINLIALAMLVFTLFTLSAAGITLNDAANMEPEELQERLMEWLNSVQ